MTCRDERGGGFYAYAAASIERTSAPGAGAAQHARSGAVNLLSRLAVDRNERGKGPGAHLVRDRITRGVAAAERAGVLTRRLHGTARTPTAFYPQLYFEPPSTDSLHLPLLIKDTELPLSES